MFKPTSAKDRINYGEALIPPIGFRLEHAVGTTYSLDLETLAAVSIALGLKEDTDSEFIDNPLGMLRALQKISDRIVVFCEAGKIKQPAKANELCLILEKMVAPVKLQYDENINRYPAFHPKTWILEYSNEKTGEKRYRFIVMSRNMTFDHSWDIACALDGDLSSSGNVNTQPLVYFLNFLHKQLNNDLKGYNRQNENLNYMIEAISKVSLSSGSAFAECEILPIGIGTGSVNMDSHWLFKENFHELVIMSPFLSGSVIEEFNDARKTLTETTRTLITRRSELSKIKGGKASHFDVYVMKDKIIDGESAVSDGETQKHSAINKNLDTDAAKNNDNKEPQDNDTFTQDIHAKIYVRMKNHITDLFLGSMNASHAAIHSNVEMMLRLRPKPKHRILNGKTLNGKTFLDDIMGEDRESKKNPFEKVDPENVYETESTTVQDDIEQKIKMVCRIKMTAKAAESDGKYDVHMTADIADIDGTVDGILIRPLRSKKDSPLLPEMSFKEMDKLQLSEFYVVSATIDDCTLERVIMIPTEGIPEGREAEIIKNVIKTKNQFIEYIAFILGDDYVQTYLENKKASGATGEHELNTTMPAVYEKMLKASVANPDKLTEIQYITKAIQEEAIIPPEFREMYKVFRDTLGI
ncbi:hypothetical protein [Succinimonas sp.]|uniref:hypothetical protein n=1 Tax=Succinimonas sp. TaxID=1936151 RepID=UPI003863798A